VLDRIPWGSDLRALGDRFSEEAAVSDGERTLSFRDLAGAAGALAARLRQAGVAPGTPVATFLRNGLPAVWASYGIRVAGGAETPINPGFGEAERHYCAELIGLKHVVTTRDAAPLWEALGCGVIAVEDVAPDRAALDRAEPIPGAAWGRISFTSGTTGKPKAIVHTHASRWLSNVLQRATLPRRPGPGSRVLLMTPFTHGASILTYAFHDHGGSAVLLDAVDAERVERLLASGEVDHVFAPPTVLAKLAASFECRRFDTVKTIFCGTAPLTPALYQRTRAIFGPVVRVTYGKSEINNPITVLEAADCERFYAGPREGEGVCVGWPASGVEIEIRDDDGAPLPPDEVGEVHLHGAHLHAGLIDASGFHPRASGEFHATGDLGRVDRQGRLHLVGRTADVIKSGGYKVFPEEIETMIAPTLAAGAAVVVGVPSEYWGEVIIAVAEGADDSWAGPGRKAVAAISRWKQPRAWVTLPALPRNAQGKIPRAQVRALVLERWRLTDGPYPKLEPK
jgi:acyl-CoA synthetase (AMP-forming)/AMP-acid ligase II